MKRILSLFLCFAALFSLCACGAESQPVTIEQTGQSSAEQLPSQADTAPANTTHPFNMDFVSDDGLIHINIHDDNVGFIPATMPVLRARPQIITSDMARQMAEAVFGDAAFFEYSEELSKAEVSDMIAVWENAVSDEAIRADHGDDAPQDWIDSVRDGRLEILEFYRNAYAYAREEVAPVPCQWKFWPIEHYAIHGHDYAGTDPFYTDNIPSGISVDLRAVTAVNGIPYEFWVNNNEQLGFRNHSLSIFVQTPDELFSGGLSDEVRQSRQREWNTRMGIYSSAPATDEELIAACGRATQLAADMGLGEWIFSARQLDRTNTSSGGWLIELEGQAIYEGFPVSWQNPSESHAFAPETMTINMKNDGTIIDLQYNSPLEIVEIVEQNVQLKQWEEMNPIVSQTIQSLTCDTVIPNYAVEKSWWDDIGAQISETKVDIDSVCIGYTRLPYDATDFLFIPTLSFIGKMEVVGTIPGVHESPMDLLIGANNSKAALLTFDLRDGKLI